MVRTHCKNGHNIAEVGRTKHRECRACKREHNSQWAKAHPRRRASAHTQYDADAKRQRYNSRAKIAVIAKGNRCWDCGGEFMSRDLHFHHRDPHTKVGEISNLIPSSSEARLRAEIRKCDVLCASCHQAAHRELAA